MIKNFYPTPDKLICKLIDGVKFDEISSILEPSAGQGHIVDYINERYELSQPYYRKGEKLDIDCIEINENLRHILKGKGYRVVHDDFLTFETFKRYDAILMNPPFDEGDKHLLKALDLMKNGGIIRCILNAETIRNPFSNTRKDLVRRLDELDADIKFIKDAFLDAERKTAVEIALIKVAIPEAPKSSFILHNLKKEEIYTVNREDSGTIVEADFLKRIVAQYNFEVQAGLKLLEEYFAMKPYVMKSFKKEPSPYERPAISVIVGDEGSRNCLNDWEKPNEYIKLIRYKYWNALFQSDMFANIFTTKLRQEYYERIQDLKNYDFSFYNIYTLKAELVKSMSKSIEETILALFDKFSHKHHWYDETSKNIHYYNGWKTNSAWKINKRVVVPHMNAFDSWSGEFRPYYEVCDKLKDIEKVFDYLDGGRSDHVDLDAALKRAEETGQTKKIQLKYFNVTFYKKGTCHIEFTNLDLLKKFNLFGSQKKGWLPPSYGKANYEDMSQEEKTVIDSYEGEAEYRKVLENKDYFISEIGLPLLEAS